jgi:aerobic carbon-monoxide dehydrogenase medium subunit
MKPAAVDYARPRSLSQALELLARPNTDARVIAGGQSLVAMMNLRVASPGLLVDIARLPDLGSVTEEDSTVFYGACVTHAMIEDRVGPDPSQGLMPKVAETLAYRAVRNRGTIGGSLALADPAAEWPAVLAALDATAIIEGWNGKKAVACKDFVTGIYETRLGAGEIIVAIWVPKLSPQARWGYVKLARKAGEFALSLAVAVRDPARGYARVVLGAADGPPLVLEATSRLCARGRVDAGAAREAIAADLARAADRQFDTFHRSLHATAALRALTQATQAAP